MKYFFLCLLVLGLVGCGGSVLDVREKPRHGPDTGWVCPDCDWGVSRSAKACPHCGADLESFPALSDEEREEREKWEEWEEREEREKREEWEERHAPGSIYPGMMEGLGEDPPNPE